MPAVVQHLRGLVDSFDVASAAEMLVALDTPMPADRVSFAGPGKTPAELAQAVAAGVTIEMESETEAAARRDDRRAARRPPARRGPRQPGLRGQGLRHADGRRPAAVRRRRRAGARRCSHELRHADLEFLGFHIFAGSQNLNAEILCEAQRKTVELALRLADAAPGAGPLPQPRRRLRHPVLREATSRSTSPRSAPTSQRLLDERDPAATSPTRAWSIELGRYIVGECGRLRDPGRRPQGVARQDLPGRRRRAAPPARRVRQLRPGDPPQLPRRDRRADGDDRRDARPSASSAACARRSTCSPTTSRCRAPTSATSSSSSRPAPTA